MSKSLNDLVHYLSPSWEGILQSNRAEINNYNGRGFVLEESSCYLIALMEHVGKLRERIEELEEKLKDD